jgi:hypothetical protein
MRTGAPARRVRFASGEEPVTYPVLSTVHRLPLQAPEAVQQFDVTVMSERESGRESRATPATDYFHRGRKEIEYGGGGRPPSALRMPDPLKFPPYVALPSYLLFYIFRGHES